MLAIGVLPAFLVFLFGTTPTCAFIGIGIHRYDPTCAYACRSVISGAALACHTKTEYTGNNTLTSTGVTPDCRASSAPFLITLAICVHDRCTTDLNPPTHEKLEHYWYDEATGDEDVPPMWSYQEAYDKVNKTPTGSYDSKKAEITGTVLIKKDDWDAAKLKMEASEWQQTLYARYALTMFLVGAGLPIALTALTYLPFTTTLSHYAKPWIIHPSILGQHVQPILTFFHLPTVGQSIFIVTLFVLMSVFTIVDYGRLVPGKVATQADILNYLGMRTGIIAIGLLPLTFLFAGRNNLLLWLSNWSHSTYLLLHRWIARLCLIEIILHSLVELIRYNQNGKYTSEVVKTYWQWGIVGTIGLVFLVVTGVFRRYSYEIFLISHIIMAVIVLVASWYHITIKNGLTNGYEYWLYLCCAIWFFDRLVRIGRIIKTGVRKATVTPIGTEVVRIDIPGIRWSTTPGQHAYVFLPATRQWAPWENHPFSVIPTALLTAHSSRNKLESIPSNSTPSLSEKADPQNTSSGPSFNPHRLPEVALNEKAESTASGPSPSSTGVTLFVKRTRGLTATFPSSAWRLSALLDGPYRHTSSRPVLATDRLILFAGGIGITGVLPFIYAHPNVKLYWSVRPTQAALVEEIEPSIPGHVERSIKVGGRNDMEGALEEEQGGGWGLVGVVVCGPGGMCDSVRQKVSYLGRQSRKTKWELDVEAFLW